MKAIPGRALAAAAVFALALGLSACDGTSSAQNSSEPDPSDTPTSVTRDPDAELVIWADDARAKVLQPFLDEFGEENGITAVVQTVNDNGRDSFITATLADNGPDLVIGAHDWLGKFIENGVIEPLPMSQEAQAEFLPSSIAAATSDGNVYGVPYAVENIGLVRNVALAPEAPATIEEAIATGQQLVAAGTVTNPFAMPIGQSGQPYYVEPLLTSAGGYIFGKTAEGDYNADDLGIDSAGGLAAADKISWLAEQGALSSAIDYNEALDLFLTGKTPYLVAGPWATADFQEAGIDYAISPVPGFEGADAARPFLGVQLVYVSSKAKNQTFAEEFALNYMTRPDVQRALFDEGQRPPALASVNAEVSAENPDLAAWSAAGENGDPMPSISAMDAVWGPLGIAVVNIVDGQGDPATIFTEAASSIREAIGG